jgi:hypothetical protein
MNARSLLFLIAVVLSSSLARADDRTACAAGDKTACARIGQLKQQGALKTDGTKNTVALIDACSKALEGARSPGSMSAVNRACNQLFNADLQKSWNAVAGIAMPGLDALLGTAFAEAYCPKLTGKLQGCNGKRAANFSKMKSADTREALRALTTGALALELGAEQSAPLVEKFNAAWEPLLGAP